MHPSFKHYHRKQNPKITPLLALAMVGQLGASETASKHTDLNAFDKTWALAMLYKDDLNPVLQEIKLRGRYHGQYHDVNADNGNANEWEDRRSRFGFDAKLFDKQLEMRFDFQSNDGFEDIYDGLVDAYLKWKPNDKIAVTVGKTKPLIAYGDWISSTNETPAFERSQIFNQLGINRSTALALEAESGGILWQAGIYSNDTPNSTGGSGAWGDGEFGGLNGGYAFSLGAGYNFNSPFDVEKALFRLDWLHSERSAADVVLNRYDDIISTAIQLKERYWNLTAEAFAASGGDDVNGDVFGFYLQPTYDIIPDKLQLVGRYSYANGDGPASVQAQNRYERESPIKSIPGIKGSSNRGDAYQAVYLGAQYFIYGNKLKLMGGAEWAHLSRDGRPTGYDGITTLAGIRFSF